LGHIILPFCGVQDNGIPWLLKNLQWVYDAINVVRFYYKSTAEMALTADVA